jgi:hypothetical protein
MQSSTNNPILRETLYGLCRSAYVSSLGFPLFPWQGKLLDSHTRRKSVNGSRQSGKSTIVSSIPCHTAKYVPGSLSIVLAPTERQAQEDIIKVKDFISADKAYPELTRESQDGIELANGSRIIVIPATERSARGYSKPRVIVMDEASRILDVVYKSGIRPMLTDNPECEMFSISTPNGKQGFFYEAHTGRGRWERYEIRSPWTVDPDDEWNLLEAIPEEQYQAEMQAKGIRSWYSPRHWNKDEQLENLIAMGRQQYQQEYCCEFVEQEDMVFSYDDIEKAFGQHCKGIDVDIDDIQSVPGIAGFGEVINL